jgi:hypothetical protein
MAQYGNQETVHALCQKDGLEAQLRATQRKLDKRRFPL